MYTLQVESLHYGFFSNEKLYSGDAPLHTLLMTIFTVEQGSGLFFSHLITIIDCSIATKFGCIFFMQINKFCKICLSVQLYEDAVVVVQQFFPHMYIILRIFLKINLNFLTISSCIADWVSVPQQYTITPRSYLIIIWNSLIMEPHVNS